MTTNPHAPAWPSSTTTETSSSTTGLSVRAYVATRAMERLLADTALDWKPSSLAKCSVAIADALIAELNKPTTQSE